MLPEFHRPLALARIPPEGREERIEARAEECAALAARFGIPAVERLSAGIRLRPEAGGTVFAEGHLSAEVVQTCVVTLEPVRQAVSEAIALRILAPGAEPSDDPEGPDEIEAEDGTVDLGEAVAEQLSLALDPYPRAPGAELPVAGEGGATPSGPFAALAALRGQAKGS
ncbi:YceD family protein [Neoroseomonas rubea]|uniref:YceD family protein n=1 Tax=Neoroseomonas rubea TaxID=2748666 RepID=UPI0018DFF784|nr:DUF177 domain-containing protein [Roseomonas rubea]